MTRLKEAERHAIEAILDRPYGDPDDDAAIVARAALRLDSGMPAIDVTTLGESLHEIYCHRNAPMHSAPDHSAARIAVEYRRIAAFAAVEAPS